MNEDGPVVTPSIETEPAVVPPRPVAPVWHTVVLVAGILFVSKQSASQFGGAHAQFNRLSTYVLTGATELVMLGWIFLGLKLKKIPFRSLLGFFSGNLRSIVIDLGFAAVFWIASLTILGTIGMFWAIVEAAIKHHSLFHAGQPL